MTDPWVIVAVGIPWAAGIALVHGLGDRAGGRVLAVGAGWFAGQALVMGGLYAMLVMSGAGNARGLLGLLAAFAGVLLFVGKRLRPPGVDCVTHVGGNSREHSNPYNSTQCSVGQQGVEPANSRFHKRLDIAVPERCSPTFHAGGRAAGRGGYSAVVILMIILIAASMIAKLGVLAAAHAWVPSRNDDALAYWLFKAKVVMHLDRLPMDPADPYYLGGSNPQYPIFPCLTAAWIPMVTGVWNEHHATLPWLFTFVNLMLLVAGGLRRWLGGAAAWVVAYLVASMPLLMIHAYRPGYVDLPLGAFLAAAVLYLLAWRETGCVRSFVVGSLFIVAAACMKREGPAIAGVALICLMIPSVRLVAAWPVRIKLAVLFGGVAVIAILLRVLDFTGLRQSAGGIEYHSEVWPALYRHLVGWSSFQFAAVLVGLGWVITLFDQRALHRMPALLLTLGLFGIAVSPFLFTDNARFALNDQTPSRSMMQVMPAVMVALAVSVLGRRASNGLNGAVGSGTTLTKGSEG